MYENRILFCLKVQINISLAKNRMYENRILFCIAKAFYGCINDMVGNSKNAGTSFWKRL